MILDTEPAAETSRTTAFTNRSELPFTRFAVKLAKHHERIPTKVSAKIEPRQLRTCSFVVDADICIFDTTECLSILRSPDHNLKANSLDLSWNFCDIDSHLFFLATTRPIIIQEANSSIGVTAHISPDKPFVPTLSVRVELSVWHLARVEQSNRRDIKVISSLCAPATANPNSTQTISDELLQ
jgi:hypothetical protein